MGGVVGSSMMVSSAEGGRAARQAGAYYGWGRGTAASVQSRRAGCAHEAPPRESDAQRRHLVFAFSLALSLLQIVPGRRDDYVVQLGGRWTGVLRVTTPSAARYRHKHTHIHMYQTRNVRFSQTDPPFILAESEVRSTECGSAGDAHAGCAPTRPHWQAVVDAHRLHE